MIKKHINDLLGIYVQTKPKTNMIDLVNTYSNKITDYIRRDMTNNKPISFYLDVRPQRNRAIKVMTEYAKRKFGYVKLS